MTNSEPTKSSIIPTMRYNDANAAIDWLCEAFGFSRHLVVEDDAGGIAHAQLTFAGAMIMLGSARDDEFGKQQQPPSSPTAHVNQSPYIIVEEIDEHYAGAVAAGARVVMDIKDEDN